MGDNFKLGRMVSQPVRLWKHGTGARPSDGGSQSWDLSLEWKSALNSYFEVMSKPEKNLHPGQGWNVPRAPVPVQVNTVHNLGVLCTSSPRSVFEIKVTGVWNWKLRSQWADTLCWGTRSQSPFYWKGIRIQFFFFFFFLIVIPQSLREV